MSAMTKPRLPMLTVADTAEQLGLSTRTVIRLIDMGALHRHQFGRAVRISQDDLDSYIAKSRK